MTYSFFLFFYIFFQQREKTGDEKVRQKKKVKEKKTTKVKVKDIADDGGGWTEVKGSSSTVSKTTSLFAVLFLTWVLIKVIPFCI